MNNTGAMPPRGEDTQKSLSALCDVLKVITTLLVVFGHAAWMYTGEGAFPTLRGSRLLAEGAQLVYRFHMPLFMLLSGCVYGICLQRGKYRDPARFLLGKVRRILIPEWTVGCFFVAPVMLFFGLTKQDSFTYCLHGILLGENDRHLWFLMALSWIFLLAALLRPLTEKRPWLLFAFSLAVLFLTRFWQSNPLQLKTACIYQFWFFCGVLLCRFRDPARALLRRGWLVLPVLLAGLLYVNHVKPHGWLEIPCAAAGIAVMLGLGVLLFRLVPGINALWGWRWILRNSFGIYLFHPLFIYAAYAALGMTMLHPYLLCFGSFFLSAIISGLLTELLRRTPLSFIIGETRMKKNLSPAR